MNLPSNNPRAGVTLLESLMMLAVLALVMGLAASGFQARNRPDDPAGIRAQVAQAITLARNEAIRQHKAVQISLTELNSALKRTPLQPCEAGSAEISAFSDGTVLAPDLCTASVRIQIDWLTGIPTSKRRATDAQ